MAEPPITQPQAPPPVASSPDASKAARAKPRRLHSVRHGQTRPAIEPDGHPLRRALCGCVGPRPYDAHVVCLGCGDHRLLQQQQHRACHRRHLSHPISRNRVPLARAHHPAADQVPHAVAVGHPGWVAAGIRDSLRRSPLRGDGIGRLCCALEGSDECPAAVGRLRQRHARGRLRNGLHLRASRCRHVRADHDVPAPRSRNHAQVVGLGELPGGGLPAVEHG